MTLENRRLNILTEHEIKGIFGFPRFSLEDRKHYINLDAKEMEAAESFKTTKAKIYFILQSSYFKSTGIFHEFEFQNVKRDTNYILNKFFDRRKIKLVGGVWKKTRLDQRKLILKLYGYKSWDESTVSYFMAKLLKLSKIHANHVDVFKEAFVLLRQTRTILPPYRVLQGCLSKAISQEKERLKIILDKKITKSLKSQLNKMLKDDDSICNLSFLRLEAKNFNKGELAKEIKRWGSGHIRVKIYGLRWKTTFSTMRILEF